MKFARFRVQAGGAASGRIRTQSKPLHNNANITNLNQNILIKVYQQYRGLYIIKAHAGSWLAAYGKACPCFTFTLGVTTNMNTCFANRSAVILLYTLTHFICNLSTLIKTKTKNPEPVNYCPTHLKH